MANTQDTTIKKSGLVLALQVKAMLDSEAYHYCADCHTHCRQTILAVEAAKEASKAYDALREAASEALRYIQLDPVLDDDGIAVIKQLRAALVDVQADEEVKR